MGTTCSRCCTSLAPDAVLAYFVMISSHYRLCPIAVHTAVHRVLAKLLQANQEKLSRMLGSINAMFLMCFRLSKLHEAGKMSHADASMVKAWTTLRGDLPLQIVWQCIPWQCTSTAI